MSAHKRILFVTPPGYGHAFPIVPLAWAMRGSGAEVLVATCGVSLTVCTKAGLSAINAATGVDLNEIFLRFKGGYRNAFHDPDTPFSSNEISGETVFTALGEVMLGGLNRVIEQWRPDLIVYTPYATAAPIAAARFGLPSIFLGIAIAYTPVALFEGTYARMTRTWEEQGIERPAAPVAWIDVAPPSLRRNPEDGILMRYLPFNGADLVNDERWSALARPRIAVTLGTVVPSAEGLGALSWLPSVASAVDADFVLAHGSTSTAAIGALPANVQAHSWIPLDHLVATSQAIIHHGGPGSMFTAVAAGLPQMVLPRGSDQFYNAEVLRTRGVALVSKEAPGSDLVTCLLADLALREAAKELQAEREQMPTPADIVPGLLAHAG